MDQRIQCDLAEVPFEFDWLSFEKTNCDVISYGFQPEKQEDSIQTNIFVELTCADKEIIEAKLEAIIYNARGAIIAEEVSNFINTSDEFRSKVIKVTLKYRASEDVGKVKIILLSAKAKNYLQHLPHSYYAHECGYLLEECVSYDKRDYTRISIRDLDLTVRTTNSLDDAGIRMISDIQAKLCTPEDCMKIKGLGKKGMEDIILALINYKIPHPMNPNTYNEKGERIE